MTSIIFSWPGQFWARRRSTANGLSVRSLTLRTSLRKASGFIRAAPMTPRPPASDTAATRPAIATPPIPAWMIGYSMPSFSVSCVWNMAPSYLPLNWGLRFSKKAAAASLRSSLLIVAASRNMDESRARLTWSRRSLLMENLVQRMASGAPRASRRAIPLGPGRTGQDNDTQRGGDGAPQPGAVAVDRRHDRLLHLQQVRHEAAHHVKWHRRPAGAKLARLHPFPVAAGAEGRTGAGEDDGPHVIIPG